MWVCVVGAGPIETGATSSLEWLIWASTAGTPSTVVVIVGATRVSTGGRAVPTAVAVGPG